MGQNIFNAIKIMLSGVQECGLDRNYYKFEVMCKETKNQLIRKNVYRWWYTFKSIKIQDTQFTDQFIFYDM